MEDNSPKLRFHVIDALRGFAIVSILLLHNIEHFDVYFFPTTLSPWMVTLDKYIWDTLFFLFGGKSYAIFSLLFGLTYYIQSNNQAKKGLDFGGRFAWRMLLLFGFGMINSMFFQGDVLSLYAVVGLLLIPFSKLSSKTLVIVAVVFFIQPLEIYHLIFALQHPDIVIGDPESWTYFGKMLDYVAQPSFVQTVIGNMTNGKYSVLLWNWENGRYFHMVTLFLTGYLLGRAERFASSEENTQYWKKVLITSSVIFVPLFAIKTHASEWISSAIVLRSFETIETSWTNVSFMLVLVSGFYLLYHAKLFHKALNVLSPIGKMSLSNYVFQSIAGACIYYGFGLGLYQYTGATYGILIGITLAVLFGYGCTWWAKHHAHGPLEGLWHKATWIKW